MPGKTKSNTASKSLVTETGIIVPVAWDEQGCPVELALSTYRESEYLIDTADVTGRALFKFLRRKVKIIGSRVGAFQDRQKIIVLGFVVMKDSHSKPYEVTS